MQWFSRVRSTASRRSVESTRGEEVPVDRSDDNASPNAELCSTGNGPSPIIDGASIPSNIPPPPLIPTIHQPSSNIARRSLPSPHPTHAIGDKTFDEAGRDQSSSIYARLNVDMEPSLAAAGLEEGRMDDDDDENDEAQQQRWRGPQLPPPPGMPSDAEGQLEGKLKFSIHICTVAEAEDASSSPGARTDPSLPKSKVSCSRTQGNPLSIDGSSWRVFESAARRGSQQLENLILDNNLIPDRPSHAGNITFQSRISISNPGQLVSLPRDYFDASSVTEDEGGNSPQDLNHATSGGGLSSHVLSVRGMTREPISPFPQPFNNHGDQPQEELAMSSMSEGADRTLIRKEKVMAALAYQPTPPPLPPNAHYHHIAHAATSCSPEGVRGGGFHRRGSLKKKVKILTFNGPAPLLSGPSPFNKYASVESEQGSSSCTGTQPRTATSRLVPPELPMQVTANQGQVNPVTSPTGISNLIQESTRSWEVARSPWGSFGDHISSAQSLESQGSGLPVLTTLLLEAEPLLTTFKGRLVLNLLLSSAPFHDQNEFENIRALVVDVFGDSSGIEHGHVSAIPGYSIGRIIGEGAFGQVRLGVHHLSRERVAVKVFDKMRFSTSQEERTMRREVRVMRHLTGHERIVCLYETLEKDRWLYLVMEHCPGGNLFEYVSSRKALPEPEAARLSHQLIEGLSYCHSMGVAHRDLKLENVMVDERGNIKIIDLGLSAFFSPNERLNVYCGSPSYVSPEIISHIPYLGPPTDVWSLGVMTFGMISGYLPFYGSADAKPDDTLDRRILRGKFRIPSTVSPKARDLLQRTLVTSPELRITLRDMASHPWFDTAVNSSVMEEDDSLIDEGALAAIEASLGHSRITVLEAIRDEFIGDITASYVLLTAAYRRRGFCPSKN